MLGYQYLNNEPRMDAIQQIGQTGGGLAYALPQLQIQAQAFRQRLALQRAQELLNEQRMNESKARQKLYEGEQTLKSAQAGEVAARTDQIKGTEQRAKDAVVGAMALGQALGHARAMAGVGQPMPQPDLQGTNDMSQAITIAGLLSARDPRMLSGFMQQIYPNEMGKQDDKVIAPQAVLTRNGQPIYTNMNSKAESGISAATQGLMDRFKKKDAAASDGGGFMGHIKRMLGMGGGETVPTTNVPTQSNLSRIRVRSKDGTVGSIPFEQKDAALKEGYTLLDQ